MRGACSVCFEQHVHIISLFLLAFDYAAYHLNMAIAPKTRVKNGSILKKGSISKIGAPAQRNQASRKGKKAWRKNVDLEDVDEKIEGLREEERQFGYVQVL